MHFSRINFKLIALVAAVALTNTCQPFDEQQKKPELSQHDYLVELYDRLHDSPLQNKFKRLQPMPTGVVYVQRPGEGEAEMRWHFRTMKELGFNCLKQIMTTDDWTEEQVELIALEEGIIPWWYGLAGWETITPELLRNLNIHENATIEQIRQNPAMLAYQKEVMRQRIEKTIAFKAQHGNQHFLSGRSVAFEPEIGGRGFELSEKGKQLFVAWVKEQYKTIESLNFVYNQNHAGLNQNFVSWEDFERRWTRMGGNEYRHLRDILRFKVEHALESIEHRAQTFKDFDSNAVFRGGGELGLFHPQAWYGVDLERIANLMTHYGSFYPSIHFSWHFGEVNYELVRPFYMQSSQATDYFKGGWAATWETTGGPQQFSGGRGGYGFTVDEGVMTQFILSQIAAGFKGFGLWCWTPRTAGWEAGEYALLDRQNQVTPRAVKVGQIAQAMERYSGELWSARKEPVVGILTDWDNEALWAAMTVSGRDTLKHYPMWARVGVSRALINSNIPFEYVTVPDLEKGLAPRYPVIYLPAQLFMSDQLVNMLYDYVQQGGRLVMDMPSAYYNQFAALMNNGKGTRFEQLFGTVITDFQYSGKNITRTLNNVELRGFIIDQAPTTAKVVATFNNGLPAITENNLGKGTAMLLGYEASISCFKPNNTAAEKILVQYVANHHPVPYICKGALVYRLASPAADHYFLIKDGDATAVRLDFAHTYKSVSDAITGESVNQKQISIEANSGRWLRCEK